MTTDCERITLSLGKPLIMNTNKSFKYWIAQEVEETFEPSALTKISV